MSMWSISTRSSPVSSMQTTFGPQCKGEDEIWESMLSGVSWRRKPCFSTVIGCWCFYTLGLFHVINRTICSKVWQTTAWSCSDPPVVCSHRYRYTRLPLS
jgi:hypothetical protein